MHRNLFMWVRALFKRGGDKTEIKNQQIQERWRRGIENRLEVSEKRFPIVIRAGTALSSPEDLKDMLDLESIPKTFTTKTASLLLSESDYIAAPREEIVYCEVSWEQVTEIKEKGWAS
ncbi:hypothetical protein GGS24DRAFT_474021 [Hypoxylon argillaceum]|nr:hypothetical protein GGS24DRAFT_474021 [Hypoxylon argillaceum]